MPCLVVKKAEMRWALALAGSLGGVAKLDMMVGLVTDRRSEREAVILVAEGSAMWQRSAVIGECSRRRPGMEANSGQRDQRLY